MNKPPTYTGAGEATRSVAAHIRANRRARGWSVRELAERLAAIGCPMAVDSISRTEEILRNGKRPRRVTVDELVAIAEVFDADPADWLTSRRCDACDGAPPVGYTCNECGASS